MLHEMAAASGTSSFDVASGGMGVFLDKTLKDLRVTACDAGRMSGPFSLREGMGKKVPRLGVGTLDGGKVVAMAVKISVPTLLPLANTQS
jgi:hypothetical protein